MSKWPNGGWSTLLLISFSFLSLFPSLLARLPSLGTKDTFFLSFTKLFWALYSFYITRSYTTGFRAYDETFPSEANCLLKLFPCLHLLGSAQLTPFRNLRRTSIAAPMEPISSEQSHPHFSDNFSALVIASSAEPSQKTLTVYSSPRWIKAAERAPGKGPGRSHTIRQINFS